MRSWHKCHVCPLGLGMLQASGLCVVGDKLNFIRYLSHFRCIHRGAAFSQMRTTTVRKLLPESWGFLCPVDTPDGEPCGLMNHMTALCEIVTEMVPVTDIPPLLCSLGMFHWPEVSWSVFLSYSPALQPRAWERFSPQHHSTLLRWEGEIEFVLYLLGFCLVVDNTLLVQAHQPFEGCKIKCQCLSAVFCRVWMFTEAQGVAQYKLWETGLSSNFVMTCIELQFACGYHNNENPYFSQENGEGDDILSCKCFLFSIELSMALPGIFLMSPEVSWCGLRSAEITSAFCLLVFWLFLPSTSSPHRCQPHRCSSKPALLRVLQSCAGWLHGGLGRAGVGSWDCTNSPPFQGLLSCLKCFLAKHSQHAVVKD